MAEQKKPIREAETPEGKLIERIHEQPADAISFYSDIGQVFATGQEMVMQFYETIPGPPDREGRILKARTRLRVTITVSYAHARNLGKLLMEKASEEKK
jgi:hypothetical protein